MSKTLTAFVMVLGLVALTACEKPAGEPTKDANKPATPEIQPAPGAPVVPPAAPAATEPATTTAPAATAPAEPVAAAPAGDLEVIPLELPKPRFSGTPKNLPPGTRVKLTADGGTKPRDPFKAPKGVTNVALKKPVIASDMEPVIGTLDLVTDGSKEAVEDAYVELGLNVQWVQIDLGAEYDIYAIVTWHEHKDPRVYKDVVIQVADDKDFITNVRTVYNNDHDNSAGQGLGEEWEFFETNEGHLVDCKGIKARYVRAYSNGNNADDLNRYSEIEVYGLPSKK
jgi:hypothetical protein